MSSACCGGAESRLSAHLCKLPDSALYRGILVGFIYSSLGSEGRYCSCIVQVSIFALLITEKVIYSERLLLRNLFQTVAIEYIIYGHAIIIFCTIIIALEVCDCMSIECEDRWRSVKGNGFFKICLGSQAAEDGVPERAMVGMNV